MFSYRLSNTVFADSILDVLLSFNSDAPIRSDLVANPNAFSFTVDSFFKHYYFIFWTI